MARCVRCGKANEFQPLDYRCYECFGEASPRAMWTDPESRADDTTSPITWPRWWSLAFGDPGKGYCSAHNCYFLARGCCLTCVAEKRV